MALMALIQSTNCGVCVKTHVVELNKLGRGQAAIQACGGSEFQRAPACAQPIALSGYQA